jgi:hypothetical protein
MAGGVLAFFKVKCFAHGEHVWTPASDLRIGERIATATQWVEVEDIQATKEVVLLYNFRITQHHTYFVGKRQLGIGIWVHNSYDGDLGNAPVKGNQVMDFEQSVARSVTGDGLTGDHIPSNAALIEWWTNLMGRKLTKAEAKSIRNAGNTIIEECPVHVAGRTFGGKNTAAQIAGDAADLRRAAIRDTMQFRKNALAAGHNDDDIMAAIIELHIRNRAAGIY